MSENYIIQESQQKLMPVNFTFSPEKRPGTFIRIDIMVESIKFRAWLFKTKDVVSFVKISNVNISNMPIFIVEKM